MSSDPVKFRPFTSEEMIPHITEFKKQEFEDRLIKTKVLVIGNVAYISTLVLTSDGNYIPSEVLVYCFFNSNSKEMVVSEKQLRTQIIVRVFESNLHIGIHPDAQFNVRLQETSSGTNCTLEFEHGGNSYCPFIEYFSERIGLIEDFINDAISNPYLTLDPSSVKDFIERGSEWEIYNNEEDRSDYGLVEYDEDGEINQENSDFEYLMELSKYNSEMEIDSFFRFAGLAPFYNPLEP